MPHPVLILTDPAMTLHDPGPGHPERPARLRAIHEMLDQLTLDGIVLARPQAATQTHIQRVHDAAYIDRIDALRGTTVRLDADTAVSSDSVNAAYLAAGAAINAVETLFPSPSKRESARRAFALVRPPGHHAEHDRAMGFCLFNNIAIAAAHAIEHLGCQRVLIVDWDVHHGNGTQNMFYDRRDVLYFSSHQSPLYPGTGALEAVGTGAGEGFTVNAPMPAGTDDADMVALYQRLLVPIADAYQPDLVLVSAGFDAHHDDPLAGISMTERGFASLCRMMRDIADRHAKGRLALLLEGGYSLTALTRSVEACLRTLLNDDPNRQERSEAFPEPDARSRPVIDEICAAHRRYWPV